MKSQYTQKIETVPQAFAFIKCLFDDGLLIHFDDDVRGIKWNKDLGVNRGEWFDMVEKRVSEAREIFDSFGYDIFVPALHLHKFGDKVIIWRDGNDIFWQSWQFIGAIDSNSIGVDFGAYSWTGDIRHYNDGRDDDRIEIEWYYEDDEMPDFVDWIESELGKIYDEFCTYKKLGVIQEKIIPTKEEAFGIYFDG